MIRPFTCLCLLVAAGSGLFLYNSKHSAQMVDQDIARIVKSAQENRARAALLRAEYDRLGDPERLKELAGQVLTLVPTDPKQFASLADLDKRLPAVAPPPVLVPELSSSTAMIAEPPPASAPVPIADKPVIERPAPQALAMVSHPAIIAAPHPAQPPLISQSQAATAAPVVTPVTLPKPTPLHPVADAKPPAPRQAATPLPAAVAAARPRPPAPAPIPAPPQASDMIARLVRNVPSDPPAPMVASALGMARTMMPLPAPARP